MVTEPVGVLPDPVTAIATCRESVSEIVVFAGVTVTVGVAFCVPPPPPPPPQPAAKKLAAISSSTTPRKCLYRFDHPGRKKISSEARAAPPAAPNQPVPFEARRNAPEGAGVVLTVT